MLFYHIFISKNNKNTDSTFVLSVFLCLFFGFAHGDFCVGTDVIEQRVEIFLSCEAANLFLIAFVNDYQIGYRAVNFPLFIKAFGNGKPLIDAVDLTNGNIAAAV